MRYLLLILLIIPLSLRGQPTIEREVINAGGASVENGQIILDYSIGEPMIETVGNSNVILTQGFIQSDDKGTGVEFTENNISVKLYPNPATKKIILEVKDLKQLIEITIHDLRGQEFFSNSFNFSDQTIQEIDISNFPSGTYLISLSNKAFNKKVKFVKVD